MNQPDYRREKGDPFISRIFVAQRGGAQYGLDQKKDKDTGGGMDQDVCPMVARNIVLMHVVVESKADVGDGTMGGRTFKSRFLNAFPGKVGQANMGVMLNIAQVIKNERVLQGIGIDQDDTCHQNP